jgi:hypothetical protein
MLRSGSLEVGDGLAKDELSMVQHLCQRGQDFFPDGRILAR